MFVFNIKNLKLVECIVSRGGYVLKLYDVNLENWI